ncbi:MAG: N-acetyltransferase family protein, partial [Microbacterium sp.]
GKLPYARLVALDEADTVVGWIAASPTSSRPAYRGVIEHSVYIDRADLGHGIGGHLLDAFIAAAEFQGVWTIQSSIFPGNAASRRLHESRGFRVVGRRERIARDSDGAWRDTLLIERRSTVVGTDSGSQRV